MFCMVTLGVCGRKYHFITHLNVQMRSVLEVLMSEWHTFIDKKLRLRTFCD